MKLLAILLLTITLCCCLFTLNDAASIAINKDENKQTPWELKEALSATGQIKGFNGTWISDTKFYFKTENNSLSVFLADENRVEVFLSNEQLQLYSNRSQFIVSPTMDSVLIRYDVETVFRHSTVAKFDVFDIQKNSISQIHNGTKLQYCGWAPTGDKLAYVYNNNVHVHHLKSEKEDTLTTEGVNGVIYIGVPDWVYEEEVLASGEAIWWSPDGKKMAVGYFDDTEVKSYTLITYGEGAETDDQYPVDLDLKYPKPGTPNPRVLLRVIDLENISAGWTNISVPIDVVSKDYILQNVVWSDNNNLLVNWLNRRQNVSSIQLCPFGGICKEILHLEEPHGWIVISEPQCQSDGKACLFTHWINNWYNIWKLDLATGKNVQPSLGNITVLKLYGYDQITDSLYYQATLEDDPSQSHVFKNKDCLSCDVEDIDGEKCKQASALFSKNFSYYTLTCSGPNPPFTSIYSTKNDEVINKWETNSKFRQFLKTKLRPSTKFLDVELGNGFKGIAKLSLPPSLDLDNLDPSRKYPMIVNVYGGPNSARVANTFTVGWEAYLTTNQEVIYAVIDGRGTANKGKDLLFTVNNNLGTVEIEDQIRVTSDLQTKNTFIDKERIGIWGWSYGGYSTAKVIANDTYRVFQCGVSVAPVTSWLYYDTIYTERFMGLPVAEDNLENYKNSSVLYNLDNFRNHDFLLIHGSGDDNVHIQHSMQLSKELQKNDILFEEMTYPDENHSIPNFQLHLYHTMEQFWTNCLNLHAEDD